MEYYVSFCAWNLMQQLRMMHAHEHYYITITIIIMVLYKWNNINASLSIFVINQHKILYVTETHKRIATYLKVIHMKKLACM